jgi:type III pantothenate kinase
VLLALDVGNSNVRAATVEDGEVATLRSVPTKDIGRPGGFEDALGDLLEATREIVMVSVVPDVTRLAKEIAAARGISLLVADETTIPMEIRVDNPETVGDDRLVNAYAALRFHGAPAIVVDMGTATTFDVVSGDGAFIGGAIAAGAGLGLEALARGTALLPRVPLMTPDAAIGTNTVAAMQSGAVLGHSGLVHVLIRAISDELAAAGDAVPKVILTGGLSTADWAQAIPSVDVIDPYLTLEGLARLHAEVVGQPAGANT